MRHSSLPFLLACALSVPGVVAGAPDLSEDDKKEITQLFKQGLFDPAKSKRVKAMVRVRSCWGREREVELTGWVVQDGKSVRLLSDDFSRPLIPPGSTTSPVDFVKEARTVLSRIETKKEEDRFSLLAPGHFQIVMAAWLHQLGHDQLAARFVALAHKQRRLLDQEKLTVGDLVRRQMAWQEFSQAANAWIVGADADALYFMQRLKATFPDRMDSFGQGTQLLTELERGRKNGTSGQVPPLPTGLEKRQPAERVEILIQSLEGVSARQWGQPGGVDLAGDPRVRALIALGDVAVPALIKCVESDSRLTRSMHFWRDFSQNRTLLSVREAALVAVMSILRLPAFKPDSTGDSLSVRGEEGAKRVGKRLRNYWDKNKSFSLPERLVRTLLDKKSTTEQLKDAAQSLAGLGGQHRINTTVFSNWVRPRPAGTPHPAHSLKGPTAAEAILRAMDRHLARHIQGEADLGFQWEDDKPSTLSWRDEEVEADTKELRSGDRIVSIEGVLVKSARHFEEVLKRFRPKDRVTIEADRNGERIKTIVSLGRSPRSSVDLFIRREIETHYVMCIIGLGDSRVAGLVGKRAGSASSLRMRRQWALACHVLGSSGPLEKFASEFAVGSLRLPSVDWMRRISEEPGAVELRECVQTFLRAGTPSTETALYSLAVRKHPYHRLAWTLVRTFAGTGPFENRIWTAHPFFVRLLRRDLDDPMAPGATRAAMLLCTRVVGLPIPHPQGKDPLGRLKELRELVDRTKELRELTQIERRFFGVSAWDRVFVPAIKTLPRAATAKDVAAGRAIFHQNGQGVPSKESLPKAALLKLPKGRRQPVLVLQIERSPGGELVYGVVGWGRLSRVAASELERIRHLPTESEQQAAARRLFKTILGGNEAEIRRMLAPRLLNSTQRDGGPSALVRQMRATAKQQGEAQFLAQLAPDMWPDKDGSWKLGAPGGDEATPPQLDLPSPPEPPGLFEDPELNFLVRNEGWIRRTIQGKNPVASAHYVRGLILYREKKSAMAISVLTKAIKIEPKWAAVYGLRASVKEEAGDRAGAIADTIQQAEIDPSAENLLGLAFTYSRQGKDRKALTYFDRTLKINPKHGQARWHRAGIRERVGDIKGAIEDYMWISKHGNGHAEKARKDILRLRALLEKNR